jgi:hypothetical protein
MLLQYNADAGEVFGISNRRQILRWKFNPFAALVNLQGHKGPAETICTSKIPLIIHRLHAY